MEPSPLLYRAATLVGEKAITADQAERNRAKNDEAVKAGKSGRLPVRPRPGRPGLLPFGHASLWRKVRDGDFPQPVRIGGIVAWRADDVQAWLRKVGA